MNFSDFFGLDDLVARLSRDMNQGSRVHAYLFVGPRGTGKHEMAEICARALNCAGAQKSWDGSLLQNDGPPQACPKPCDVCGPCQRALLGTHPDIIRVARAKSVGVDEVRALIARVMVKPYEGGMHAVIIEDAAALTAQAQNALLKTLENPPQSCVFLLICESVAQLLPTIQSRCRIVRFHELSEAVCAQALAARGISHERAGLLSGLSGGSVGVALAMDADKAYWALRERCVSALTGLVETADISRASAMLKDEKDSAVELLSIMEQLARELMRAQETAARPGSELSGIRVRGDKLLSAALSARQRVNSYVVWQNNLESFLFDLIE